MCFLLLSLQVVSSLRGEVEEGSLSHDDALNQVETNNSRVDTSRSLLTGRSSGDGRRRDGRRRDSKKKKKDKKDKKDKKKNKKNKDGRRRGGKKNRRRDNKKQNLLQRIGNVVEGVVSGGAQLVGQAHQLIDNTISNLPQNVATIATAISGALNTAMDVWSVIQAKLELVYEALENIPQVIAGAIDQAMSVARPILEAASIFFPETAGKTLEQLEDISEEVVGWTNNVSDTLGNVLDTWVNLTEDALMATYSGMMRVVMEMVKQIQNFLLPVAMGDLNGCVTNSCSTRDKLMLGIVVEALLDPITNFDPDVNPLSEQAAAELKVLYEVACGFGMPTLWVPELGEEVFEEYLEGFEDFEDFQDQFESLDECIMDKCDVGVAHTTWQVLQEGLPAYCNELLEMPTRNNAGTYAVYHKRKSYRPSDGNAYEADEFEKKGFEMILDCKGNMFIKVGDEERMAQPVQYLDIDSRCRDRTDVWADAQQSTFYVQQLFNHSEYIGWWSTLETQCLYIADDGTITGAHFGYSRAQHPPSGWVTEYVKYELIQAGDCEGFDGPGR